MTTNKIFDDMLIEADRLGAFQSAGSEEMARELRDLWATSRARFKEGAKNEESAVLCADVAFLCALPSLLFKRFQTLAAQGVLTQEASHSGADVWGRSLAARELLAEALEGGGGDIRSRASLAAAAESSYRELFNALARLGERWPLGGLASIGGIASECYRGLNSREFSQTIQAAFDTI